VQRAADVLSPSFKDAPKALLELWLQYLAVYGAPGRKAAAVCTAALEYVYHVIHGRQAALRAIAALHGVSPRLCARYARRILRANVLRTAAAELEPQETTGINPKE